MHGPLNVTKGNSTKCPRKAVLYYRRQIYVSVMFVRSSIKTTENVDFINFTRQRHHKMTA